MSFDDYLRLHKLGKLKKAENGYRDLINQKTLNSLVYTSLGLICVKTNREKEATKLFDQAININPKDIVAINNLGLIYLKKKEYRIAKNYFLDSIRINKNSKVFFYLGEIYTKLNNFEKAIIYLKESIKISKHSNALCNLGHLLYLKGEVAEAEKFTNLAIKHDSKLDIAYNNLGLINLSKGKINNAKKNFFAAIKINNNNFMAHYNLSSIIDYSKKNLHEKKLLDIYNKTKNNEDFLYLCFAYGKMYKDKKEYEKSFKFYKSANFLKRKTFNYSLDNDKKIFENIKKTFSKKLIKDLSNLGFKKKISIFIVGMPRSGTSLIEQVLSSHSKIYGAGEVNFFDEILKKYFFGQDKLLDIKLINKNNLNKAGKEYIAKIEYFAKTKKILINKLPLNFRWIGLIKLILPNALIIHCKRDPLDTCLSIFEQNFLIKGNEYTFSLDEIGHYYKLYKNCMNLWNKLLLNDFYEVEYEKFVNNQKIETEKLLKYCSLNWENNCINFHKNKSSVRTASVFQVRKKIYTSSINKSKVFEKELRELQNVLNLKKS